MAGVNLDHLHTALLCFVSKKGMELNKRPAMKTALGFNILALLPTSDLACATDVGQILNHYGATGCSILNNSFREDMITVPVKTCLFATQFLEVTFCRLASFGLKLTLEAESSSINFFPMPIAKKLTFRGNGGAIESQITPDNLIIGGNIRLGDRDNDMQPVPTIANTQISSGYSSSLILGAEGRDIEGDGDTACYGRDASCLSLPIQCIGSLIVANRTAFRLGLTCLTPLGLPVICRLQRFGSFDTGLDKDIGIQLRILLTHLIVSSMMQLYPVLFVVLPSIGTNSIKDVSKLLRGLFEKRFLLTTRLKKYLHCSIHTKSIAYMLIFCQVVEISPPYP